MSIETVEWYEDPERPGVFLPETGPIRIHRGDIFTMQGEASADPETGLIIPMPWATSKVIRDPENTCWNCGGSACRSCDAGFCPTCGATL